MLKAAFMSFIDFSGKTAVVFGVANRKSVAYFIAKTLESAGAAVVYVVRDAELKASLEEKLLAGRDVYACNVESGDEIKSVCARIGEKYRPVHSVVHSIAYANYSGGIKPFHETNKADFLQAMDISCFSFIRIADALKAYMDPDGAFVTVSISSTRMASESYGFMAPVKAALDSSVAFLAKSFSRFSRVRFNAVKSGPLKTSASAGIPGYIDNYLFTETATLRKQSVQTQEAADAAVYLLSPRASGINAQGIVVDAGMEVNYFDEDIVKRVVKGDSGGKA
jgi:enoyl-[acyl-carrier protein] reductase I